MTARPVKLPAGCPTSEAFCDHGIARPTLAGTPTAGRLLFERDCGPGSRRRNAGGGSDQSAVFWLTNYPIHLASWHQAASRIPRISSSTRKNSGSYAWQMVRWLQIWYDHVREQRPISPSQMCCRRIQRSIDGKGRVGASVLSTFGISRGTG